MTEASKAKKNGGAQRNLIRVVTLPEGYTVDRLMAMREALRKPTWFPVAAKTEAVCRPRSTPPRVVTTGISCRMGVGGRRGRRRRAAEIRGCYPSRAAMVMYRWLLTFDGMASAGMAISQGFFRLTPAAHAPTAGAPTLR